MQEQKGDFGISDATAVVRQGRANAVITTGKASGLLSPIRAWCWQG